MVTLPAVFVTRARFGLTSSCPVFRTTTCDCPNDVTYEVAVPPLVLPTNNEPAPPLITPRCETPSIRLIVPSLDVDAASNVPPETVTTPEPPPPTCKLVKI